MFVLLINDIDINLQFCNMIFYSDDIALFHSGKTSIEIENSLSSELAESAYCFSEDILLINVTKSKTDFFCLIHPKIYGVMILPLVVYYNNILSLCHYVRNRTFKRSKAYRCDV